MIESNKRLEEEKKKKKQEQIDREHYEETVVKSKTKLDIQELKYLVESKVVTVEQDLIEKIVEDDHVSRAELDQILANLDIQKLFDKLEELEKAEDIDEVMPNHLRVKKDEYLQAFQNEDIRQIVLQKFDATLNNIYTTIQGGQTMHGNLFATYTYVLHQKLIPIQENVIDLKEPLLEHSLTA